MKIKNVATTICSILLLITPVFAETCTHSYFGQTPPGSTPTLFAPGIITLPGISVIRVSFSPDGNECFFTKSSLNNSTPWRIYYSQCIEGVWTTPELAPFPQEGNFVGQPFFAADGNQLYFTANGKIYVTERNTGWTQPQPLPEPINVGNGNAVYYSETNDGTAYFASNRPGTYGELDLWRTRPSSDPSLSVENLGNAFNTSDFDYDPLVNPSGHYLLFARAGSIFVSYSDGNGGWQTPINMNALLPGYRHGYADGPSLSPDEKYLFWRCISGSQHDIYWAENPIPRPDPNGVVMNLRTFERFKSIQATLVYAQSGDTIEIQSGIYRESLVLDRDVTLKSLDPNDPYYIGGTIIQGDPNEPVLTLSHNSDACRLAGLTIRTGSIGIQGTDTQATLYHCRIMDNQSHGIELFDQSHPHLVHCLITANGGDGIMMNPTGTRTKHHCQPTLEDCVIVDNCESSLAGGEPFIINSIIED